MTRELEPWGGEVRMPALLRRVLRRAPVPEDTPERVHERRRPQPFDVTPLENVDRAIFGAWSHGHPAHRERYDH